MNTDLASTEHVLTKSYPVAKSAFDHSSGAAHRRRGCDRMNRGHFAHAVRDRRPASLPSTVVVRRSVTRMSRGSPLLHLLASPPASTMSGGGSSSTRYSNCLRNSSSGMPTVAANFASSCGSSKSSRRKRIM